MTRVGFLERRRPANLGGRRWKGPSDVAPTGPHSVTRSRSTHHNCRHSRIVTTSNDWRAGGWYFKNRPSRSQLFQLCPGSGDQRMWPLPSLPFLFHSSLPYIRFFLAYLSTRNRFLTRFLSLFPSFERLNK